MMPVWKLTPVNLNDPNWQASSHRDIVIIRARDEEAARKLAQKAFGLKTDFPAGGGIKAPPWTRADVVKAERIKRTFYEDNGPDEVLHPSFDSDLKSTAPKP